MTTISPIFRFPFRGCGSQPRSTRPGPARQDAAPPKEKRIASGGAASSRAFLAPPFSARQDAAPSISLVSRHLSAESESFPLQMMQIPDQMMQIPQTGLPTPESAYYRPQSRQIIQWSRQIPGMLRCWFGNSVGPDPRAGRALGWPATGRPEVGPYQARAQKSTMFSPDHFSGAVRCRTSQSAAFPFRGCGFQPRSFRASFPQRGKMPHLRKAQPSFPLSHRPPTLHKPNPRPLP